MDNDFLKAQKSAIKGMLSNGISNIAYMISWSWWKKWKAYVSSNLPDQMSVKCNSPGQINNKELITFM